MAQTAPEKRDWKESPIYWFIYRALPRREFYNIFYVNKHDFLSNEYTRLLMFVSVSFLFIPSLAVIVCIFFYIKNRRGLQAAVESKVGTCARVNMMLLALGFLLEVSAVAAARPALASPAACDAIRHLHHYHRNSNVSYRVDYFIGRNSFYASDGYLDEKIIVALFNIDSRLDAAMEKWRADLGFPDCVEVWSHKGGKFKEGDSDRVYSREFDISMWELQYYVEFLVLWGFGALYTMCFIRMDAFYAAAMFSTAWCILMGVLRFFTILLFSDICGQCKNVVLDISKNEEFDPVIKDWCTNYLAWRNMYLYNFWLEVKRSIGEIKKLSEEFPSGYETDYFNSIIKRYEDGYHIFFEARLNETDAVQPEWCYYNLPIFFGQLYFKEICSSHFCAAMLVIQLFLMIAAIVICTIILLTERKACPSDPCPGPPGPEKRTKLEARECLKKRYKYWKNVLLTLDEEIRLCCKWRKRPKTPEKKEEAEEVPLTPYTFQLNLKTPCGGVKCTHNKYRCVCKRSNRHRTFYLQRRDPDLQPKPVIIKVDEGGRLPDALQILKKRPSPNPVKSCVLRLRKRVHHYRDKAARENPVGDDDDDDEQETKQKK